MPRDTLFEEDAAKMMREFEKHQEMMRNGGACAVPFAEKPAPPAPQFMADRLERPTTVWVGNGHKVVLRTETSRGTIKAAWLEIVVTPQIPAQLTLNHTEDELVP